MHLPSHPGQTHLINYHKHLLPPKQSELVTCVNTVVVVVCAEDPLASLS